MKIEYSIFNIEQLEGLKKEVLSSQDLEQTLGNQALMVKDSRQSTKRVYFFEDQNR